MQSFPLLPGPISHFLLWDASLGPINRLRASSVWQRADVKEMKQWRGMCQVRMREAESRQLCFLFVGIRLTDLYLVSERPLASANPHHLQTDAPHPSKSLKLLLLCPYNPALRSNKANPYPQTKSLTLCEIDYNLSPEEER